MVREIWKALKRIIQEFPWALQAYSHITDVCFVHKMTKQSDVNKRAVAMQRQTNQLHPGQIFPKEKEELPWVGF